MKRALWDLEQCFIISSFNYEQYRVYNAINTFAAAAKPARQKKVAEQSGNIIRTLISR